LEDVRPEITGDKDALNALGITSEKRGDYKQATELFEQALKLDPKYLLRYQTSERCGQNPETCRAR
jgi:tetratricopeptide (TPR) repeat protein